MSSSDGYDSSSSGSESGQRSEREHHPHHDDRQRHRRHHRHHRRSKDCHHEREKKRHGKTRRSHRTGHHRRRREPSTTESSSSDSASDEDDDDDDDEDEGDVRAGGLRCTGKKCLVVTLVSASFVCCLFAIVITQSSDRLRPEERPQRRPGVPPPPPPRQEFFESLASSYSVTPARVSTLPVPTLAVMDPEPVADYLATNWPVTKSPDPSEFVAFVEDPLGPTTGSSPTSSNSYQRGEDEDIVFQVEYPKGQYTGGAKGGANVRLEVFGERKTRAMISYAVGFDEQFDFVKGGKLPGLFGGDPTGGCTGGKGSQVCFSARFMWRAGGEGEVYGYVPTYEGLCEEGSANETSVACHGKMGQSFNRGSFSFEPGQYTTLTEVAILNSDPSDTDDSTEANGYLAVYAGETLAFERSDMVYRTNASVFFSSVLFQTFFGGSTEDYASTGLAYTYYKDWKFYEGEGQSLHEGKQVVASIGNG